MANTMNRNLENLLRPRTLDEIIGNVASVRAVRRMLEQELLRPLLISGPWGSGKTVLAEVIRVSVAALPREFDLMREGLNFNCVDQTLADVREFFQSDSYGSSRAIVFDEADQLSNKSQTLCLTQLNKESRAQMYIFCTSSPDDIIGALQSRLFPIEMQRLAPSERTELIARAWKDERAQATLWTRDDDEYRDEFTAEVNKRGLNIGRYIYNALDEFAMGTSAEVAVQRWLDKMPAADKKRLSRAEGVARIAAILETNPKISHGQLAKELGVPVGTVREWRKPAEGREQ